jgi:hypothetical protein
MLGAISQLRDCEIPIFVIRAGSSGYIMKGLSKRERVREGVRESGRLRGIAGGYELRVGSEL